MDWTILGVADFIVALAVGAGVSALLAWKMPMVPLGPAVIAGGTAAGLILLLGRVFPGVIVVAGGLAAALAGLAHDRGWTGRIGLVIADVVIAAATAALAIPLFLLRSSLGLALPSPILLIGIGVLVALFSLALRRTDRLPGMAASIGGVVAAVMTFFAVWRDVRDPQSIWWLAIMAALLVGCAVISRARATPLGAAGTSFVALTIGILALTVVGFAGLAG